MDLLDWLAMALGALLLAAAVPLWRKGVRAGTTLPGAGPPEDCYLQFPALLAGAAGSLLFFGEVLLALGVIPG